MATIIVCGSSWGMGTSFDDDGVCLCYGFPCTDNPHNFCPDYEMCTEKEIAAWEESKRQWPEAGKTE